MTILLGLKIDSCGVTMSSKLPLELNDTFRHFNSLIWQVPSWGVAIAAGVIVAADKIGEKPNNWTVPLNYVQGSTLLFGALLLLALTIAHYRYRAYQAASAPTSPPVPPFRRKPSANTYLQGALCLTTGGLMGLAAAVLFFRAWMILAGLSLGVVRWRTAERANERVVEEIKSLAKSEAKANVSA